MSSSRCMKYMTVATISSWVENVEGGKAADNDDYHSRRMDLMAHHQKMFATQSIKRK